MVLSILVAIFPLSVIFHRYFSLDEDTKRDIWTVYFFMFNYLSIQFSFAITTVFKLLKSWYNREQKHRELEKVTVETELKFLKSQINPHFLFNTLNSLYALTLKNSEQSPDVVLKLSNILRYVLYEGAKQKRVPLSKEIDYLKSYLELEKMRLGERVDVQFDIYGDFEDKFIEPMLFVSFVENSFKHGAGGNVKGAWVKVSARVDDESKFHLNVSNSKSKAKINKDKTYQGGIGLTNTKKRLELLYPKSHTLKVEELEDKFNVNLEIQLR
jgi:two-component system LytT family sensor kinase